MTDAAFVLRRSLRDLSVLKAGCPTIGGTVGCGKPSMILSVEDMVCVAVE